jgi:hypothetical protein
MTQDISGFGARVRLVASNTFPEGIDLTQFADDTDPFDLPSLQIRDKGMGVNGDLVTWSKATPLPISLAMIPGSEDDLNLQVLFDANRVGRGKDSAADEITITVIYPDDQVLTLTSGALTDGPAGPGIASAGRKKTSTYQFVFENMSRS